MRSFIALGILLSLATAAHAAQGSAARGVRPFKRTVEGMVTMNMLGEAVRAPARVTLEVRGNQLFSRTLMRMPDGQIQQSPISRGTIVRTGTRGGATLLGVKYGGDTYRRQAQNELNAMLASHGVDLSFQFGRVEGIATHLLRADGSIQMDTSGLVEVRGLGGGLARQVAPHLEEVLPGGRLELQSTGLLKPPRSRPQPQARW